MPLLFGGYSPLLLVFELMENASPIHSRISEIGLRKVALFFAIFHQFSAFGAEHS
jgi:hypothetical protein